jgi:hypothetical protein
MLFDLLGLQVSKILSSHHMSFPMDGLYDLVNCLVHLPPNPMTIGPHASDLMAQIHFPPVPTSRCLDVDFDGPDILLYSCVLREFQIPMYTLR